MIRLVHDVLDAQVKDVDGQNAGRVDGVVIELRDGAPPIVRYLEISPITLLARVSERLARWWARHDAKIRIDRGRPFRVPWQNVRPNGADDHRRSRRRGDADQRARGLAAGEHRRTDPGLMNDARERHVERLLGRRVRDVDGLVVGRLEELHVHLIDGDPVVTEFHIGPAAALERVGSVRSSVAVLLAPSPWKPTMYRVSWIDMDLSDLHHPRVRKRRDQLDRIRARHRDVDPESR